MDQCHLLMKTCIKLSDASLFTPMHHIGQLVNANPPGHDSLKILMPRNITDATQATAYHLYESSSSEI